MNRSNRLYGILAAGILTGLVLAVVLAFGWGSKGGTAAELTPSAVTSPAASQPAGADTLQAENAQLRAALDAMQLREQAYQAQIETANQAILEMQQAPSGRTQANERYEHEENEHEHEEHEAFEFD